MWKQCRERERVCGRGKGMSGGSRRSRPGFCLGWLLHTLDPVNYLPEKPHPSSQSEAASLSPPLIFSDSALFLQFILFPRTQV